jgi:2'-5' RNA ligase
MLSDWEPEPITIDHIEVFPYEGYACVVAAVAVTDNLLEARSRLSLLPHIDLFPEYKPHITIAYVEGSDEQIKKFAANFDYLVGTTLKPKHVDYGE